MSDLVGLVAVLMLIALLGFFAAFFFWLLVALGLACGIFCAWAYVATKSGERDTRNPAREDRAA